MNGVTMTQTYGAIPSLIWVIGNVLACILFGAVACKIPKVREVFRSRPMEYICAVMCVFQAWLSMNGIQTVFADTALGPNFGKYVAYALAVIFLIILLKFGMIRNVLTDGFGWIIVYLMAAGVTIAALVHSGGAVNEITLGLEPEPMKAIVKRLIDEGKTVQEISRQLGMRPEEIFRLSDFSRDEFLAMMTDGVKGYSRAAIYKNV